MKKYKAVFTKYETYEIEANSLDEAEGLAWGLLEDDADAFILNPVDKVTIEEVSNSMLDLIKAMRHCYASSSACRGCPYEHNREKCNKLFDNIEKVINTIAEYVEFEDLHKIAKIILKEDTDNESEN